jgi:hypothetical protein
MDNLTDSASIPPIDEQPEGELNYSDKLIGVFTEPVSTFEKIAKFPLKTVDWLLPVILLFFVVCITQVALNSNKAIHSQVVEKQMTKIQQNLDETVASGKITAEQRTQQLDALQDKMENYGAFQIVFTFIGVFVGGFIMFFIMSGIYYCFVKFILKGEGNYNSVLVASGLSFYIGVINVIVSAMLSFAFGRMLPDTSVASFLDADKSTIAGFIFAKLDIFTIWSSIILSIGLAKLFKSSNTMKYVVTIFGIWILGGLLLFSLAKVFPSLKYLGM